jgi:hypothetical protein
MSGARRVPLTRPTQAQISARAVELYKQMRKLKCSCGQYPDPTKWTGRQMCEGCTRWWELHGELDSELKSKAWQWPAICPPTLHPVFDHAAGRFTDEFVPEQPDARMRALEAALREAAKAAGTPAA